MHNDSGRMAQFELLRILAMWGVVMNHVFNYGLHIYDGFSVDVSTWWGAAVWSVLQLMKLLALPSVNCYILITGYFTAETTRWRWKSLWRVWSTTWFYAVGIYLLAVCVGFVPFRGDELLRHATPLLSNSYWFVTSYVVLLLVSPLLARGLQRLSKRQYQAVLVVGGIVCFQPFLGNVLMDPQQVVLFVYLFMVGGYIRRYDVAPQQTGREVPTKTGGVVAACVGLLLLMFAYTMYKNNPLDQHYFKVFAMEYYGMVLPLSVAIFLWVVRWRLKIAMVRRAVLLVAPLSFAVYVIHTQSVVDAMLWGRVGPWLAEVSPVMLPLACLFVTMAVFTLSVAVEYVRRVCLVKGEE